MSGNNPSISTDLELGGRITSLQTPDGFEWLWTNDRAVRDRVIPGQTFIDAGGVEECFPTLAGVPDHGDVWSRPWQRIDASSATCLTPEARITRSITLASSSVHLRYRVEARPDYHFVWAFHALITPSTDLHVEVGVGHPVLSWPHGYGRPPETSVWPAGAGLARFDDLATNDGTAEFVLLPNKSEVSVLTGGRSLTFVLEAPGCPTSIGLWRNLKGYAWDGGPPYRSIGIEPMLGHNPRLAEGTPAAVVPRSGIIEWDLYLELR